MFIMLPVKVTIILQTNKHSKNFLLFLDYSVSSSVAESQSANYTMKLRSINGQEFKRVEVAVAGAIAG